MNNKDLSAGTNADSSNEDEVTTSSQTIANAFDGRSIVRKGFVQAMDGLELWVNTQTDEIIKIFVRDDKVRWNFYCKYVKITIEQIDESELS